MKSRSKITCRYRLFFLYVTEILKVNGIQTDACKEAGCSQFQTWALGLLLSRSYRRSQVWQPWIVGSLNYLLSSLEAGCCSMYPGYCQGIGGVPGIIMGSTFTSLM